jgi:predicted HAD superfamily phosphohydrolase YqeG
MIQIRDVLQVKFGKVDQAVELFTQLSLPVSERVVMGQHFEVLTDITGKMYNLVNEFVVENMAEFRQMREKQFAQPEFERWFKQFQLFVEGGQREYYNVEGKIQTWSRRGVTVVREAYQAYEWQIQTAVGLLQRYGGLLEFFNVGSKPRILTDISGPMFQAVIEIETESLSAWESHRRTLYREVEFQVWFNQMMTSVEAGTHEFFRVEYTSG